MSKFISVLVTLKPERKKIHKEIRKLLYCEVYNSGFPGYLLFEYLPLNNKLYYRMHLLVDLMRNEFYVRK
jgi:hypothetical protein